MKYYYYFEQIKLKKKKQSLNQTNSLNYLKFSNIVQILI